ncbi:hypothetical protein MC378_12420 [Polaribacter sp. MSW13]|uniref:Uncharacterized protein n=1 Tax=Polaribacter marinus TaxID=2916838 RepID=A0A9X1VNT7_9FLAO|nr:hypothetical protein [Polaribacter marinus]MCI2229974.1 hypothetical protein [Polaribacter marinus]
MSPTIISVVEKNFDISVLFNMNEEENNHKEVSKHFDLKFSETKTSLPTFNSLKGAGLFNYYSKNYTSISQENSSPPPERL